MITLTVKLGERSYPILITTNDLKALHTKLKELYSGKKIFAVSNQTILDLYQQKLEEILEGYDYSITTVPDGEEAKSLPELEKLYTSAISAGLDRHSAILAFGGGVVGDVAGFLAATLYRGIEFIQVPTTLLAQVDSSVGGKVAVNHGLGKNLIGAFYQPRAVLIYTQFLQTLPERELKCGLAEVLKYAFIWDKEFFSYLKEHSEQILSLDQQKLEHIINVSCAIKSKIVSLDEKESSLRAILNFGHTIGHALENIIGYGVIKHGEAVAIGMAQALKISKNLGMIAESDYLEGIELLKKYQLPIDLPLEIPLSKIIKASLTDKKNENSLLTFILLSQIGKAEIEKGFTEEKILRLLV